MRQTLVSVLAAVVVLAALAGTAGASGGAAGLEGTVTYLGSPVAGAVVAAGGRTVRTGTDGRFVFSSFQTAGRLARVNVAVSARGMGSWQLSDARLLPNDTLRLTVELERGPVSLSQPAPTVSPSLASGPAPSLTNTYPTFYSVTQPPSTIRVYRSSLGRVDVVSFKSYVKHVLPAEWVASWPRESLRAGAMAAKSYAWFWVNRGGKWPGADVNDTTTDQRYLPYLSYASTDRAVDDTWNYRATRSGGICSCEYWAGYAGVSSRPSGTYYGRLSQWGSEYWARQGKTWDWILRYYYYNITISTISGDITASSGPVVINKGAPYTNSRTVSVAVPVSTGDAVKVRLSNIDTTDSSGLLSKGRTVTYAPTVSWSITDSTYGGTSSDGPHRVYVQWQSTTGKWTTVKSNTITLDTVSPVIPSRPVQRLTTGIVSGGAPVLLRWSAEDERSGPASHQVQLSTDYGSFSYLQRGLTTQSLRRQMLPGRVYQFRVRTVDVAGNWSAWTYSRAFRLVQFQESSRRISYRDTWRTEEQSAAFGGSLRSAGRANARAAFSLTGSSVAWVAALTPVGDSAVVLVDGALVRTVKLTSSSTLYRRVVFSHAWSWDGAHTVTLLPTDSTDGTRIYVDGFFTMQRP